MHELKHDGYRLQIHVRDGRVRLYTMNASDWTARYPRIVEEAARIKGAAILDAFNMWSTRKAMAIKFLKLCTSLVSKASYRSG